jgi:hypothetical protein
VPGGITLFYLIFTRVYLKGIILKKTCDDEIDHFLFIHQKTHQGYLIKYRHRIVTLFGLDHTGVCFSSSFDFAFTPDGFSRSDNELFESFSDSQPF